MMKKLLEAMTKFAGEPEQKPGEQWKGTDKDTPGKKLVGDSIIKDLSKGQTPKTKEQELAEEWANFMEDDLGVEEKRPGRKSDRPGREYTKDGKPSKRYTTVKDEVEEATAAGLKVGDHITANTSKGEYPGGHKSRAGKVTRVGQTGVHIRPDDGGEIEYHPYKIVKKTVKDKDVYETTEAEYDRDEMFRKHDAETDELGVVGMGGEFAAMAKAKKAKRDKDLDEGWNTGSDRVQLSDSTSAYWNGTGRLQAEYDELYNQLVPASGAAETIQGEVLRAASKIVYRHFNDGDEFNQASFDQLKAYIGTVTSYDDLAEKAVEFALNAEGRYTPNRGWDSLDVMDYGPAEEEDDDYDDEEEYGWDQDDDEDLDEGAADVYSITSERNGRERSKSGTLAELIEYYSYTLETGKSYEHERGNRKINLNPKSIVSLVQNLNNAKSNAAANGQSNERFYIDHGNMVDEGKWFKTSYGWAGGRNEKTGGTYKHPDQIKADREAKKTAKAQQSKDAFNGMFGGDNPAKGLGIREDGSEEISSWNIPQQEWVEFEEVAEQALAAIQTDEAWEEFWQVADLSRLDNTMQGAIDNGLASGNLDKFTTDVLNALRDGYNKYGTEPRAALDLTTMLLSRGLRRLQKEVAEGWEADLARSNRERMKKERAAATPAKPIAKAKPNYDRVFQDINSAIGDTFPDGDPIDALMRKYRDSYGDLNIDLLNKACRVNGAKSYHDYVAKVWQQHMDDNPDLVQGGNPWVAEGWESGLDEPRTQERDPDAEYDAMRQEKADAEAQAQQAKRPQQKVYTLTGRGPNMEPNYKFPGEYGSQEEAVAARKKLMANPKTPNPTMIGISTHTKYMAEGIESADPIESAVLSAVQELIQQGHTEVAPEVITNMVVAATSQPFLLKDLVDANNNSPAIQHYVDSINPTKVKFSSDILTVKNEDPAKDKVKSQAAVSNMASRAANRNRLGEGVDTPLIDKDDYNAKRAQLQKIQIDPDTAKDPELKAELTRRLHSLNQQYAELQSRLTEFKESRGHKIIATKLGNLDRMQNVQIPTPAERQEQLRIAKAKEETGKKQVKEFAAPGANPAAPAGTTAAVPANDPIAKQKAQQAATATSTIKNAAGVSVAGPVLDKALDSATKGSASATDVKALAPIIGVVDKAAQDPKLAAQFRNLATQAKTS